MTTTEPEVNPKGKYTLQQARKALGVSASTFWRMRKDGIIPTHKRPGLLSPYVWGKDIIAAW